MFEKSEAIEWIEKNTSVDESFHSIIEPEESTESSCKDTDSINEDSKNVQCTHREEKEKKFLKRVKNFLLVYTERQVY